MHELEHFEELTAFESVEAVDQIRLSERIAQLDAALPSQPPYWQLRREANIQGGALLIYYAIMNIAVFFAMIVSAVAQIFTMSMAGTLTDIDRALEEIMGPMMAASGWGYLLAIAIGLLILLLWKERGYIRHTIGQKGRPMTVGTFFALLSLAMAPQLIAQLFDLGLQWLLEAWGLDVARLQELGKADVDTLGMFLYIGIAAPISEELLFRGLVLRSLAPYGKKLAIFSSALLFGLFHASPVQTPYAIMVGIVLGYVALQYHVLWAIALHIFNNLVFAMLLPAALSFLPGVYIDWILWAVIIGFFLAALLVLIAKHEYLLARWKEERVQLWQRRAVFRSPTVIILTVVCLINLVATVLMLFL